MTNHTTYIYIDGNNLYQNMKQYSGWRLDYKKFYIFLTEKYQAEKIYLFIGYMVEYRRLYRKLEKMGYVLIFKEIIKDHRGNVKGNCDPDMVLQIVQDYYENKMAKIQTKAVLVTADGDFASTIKFLKDRDALKVILAPCPPSVKLSTGKRMKPVSYLIRKLYNAPITYLSQYEKRLKKI